MKKKRSFSKADSNGSLNRKKTGISHLQSKNDVSNSKKVQKQTSGISKIRNNKIRNKQTKLIDEQAKDKPP